MLKQKKTPRKGFSPVHRMVAHTAFSHILFQRGNAIPFKVMRDIAAIK